MSGLTIVTKFRLLHSCCIDVMITEELVEAPFFIEALQALLAVFLHPLVGCDIK